MRPLPLWSLRKTGEGAWTPMGGVPGPPVQATATRCPTRVSEHRADERVWVGQGSRADQRTLVTMTLSVLGPLPPGDTPVSQRSSTGEGLEVNADRIGGGSCPRGHPRKPQTQLATKGKTWGQPGSARAIRKEVTAGE